MGDWLADSRYSVEHAQAHIGHLEREIAAFFKENPYERVIQHDPHTGIDVHKIVLKQRLPRRLPGLAFDAANNLRAALDQACYAVAIAAGLPGNKAHFPFGEDETEIKGRNRGKGKSADIPKEVFGVIVALKPYRSGNVLLWALNKIANTQKHETIISIGVGPGSGLHSLETGHATVWPPIRFPPVWDRSKQEMEVMRVSHGDTPGYKLQFSTYVCINKIEGIDGVPAIGVLRDMSSVVERSLMAIESEAIRIGVFR